MRLRVLVVALLALGGCKKCGGPPSTSKLGDYCFSKDDCAAPMFCTTLGDFHGACTIACPDPKKPAGGCPIGSSCWAASPDGPTCLPESTVGDASIPVGPPR